MLERCGTTEDTNTTKAHPFSPGNKPQKYVHTPLSGGLEGAATKIFTLRVGASWTTLLEALNKLLHTKNKLWGSFFRLGFQESKSKKQLNGIDREFKFIWWSVDLGLLPRIPKGLQVLVARVEDLVKLSLTLMEERAREWKSYPLFGEEEGFI
jgi:hypothetical protein